MYRAELHVETGYGLGFIRLSADSYKTLEEKIEKKIRVGKEVAMPISKIKYFYPSGKYFEKKIAVV